LGVDGSLAALALIVDSESDSTPTEAALQQFAKVKAEVEQYMKRWSDIQQSDLPALERAVEQQGVKPLMVK
jgi:predicted component of type VI protein secretion system